MSVTINDKPVNGGALSRLMSIVKTVFWKKADVEEGRLVTLGEAAMADISTDVSADAASDTKVSSPKSVKTYVDGTTINEVSLTVGSNTGTPTGTASISGRTLALSLDGIKGDDGDDGTDGVGIASVVQTTVSSEPGGTNVVRITLTNNTYVDVEIKNGNAVGSVTVNQAAGDSTSATMSQKAISDLAYSKVSPIAIIANRYIGSTGALSTSANFDTYIARVGNAKSVLAKTGGNTNESALAIAFYKGSVDASGYISGSGVALQSGTVLQESAIPAGAEYVAVCSRKAVLDPAEVSLSWRSVLPSLNASEVCERGKIDASSSGWSYSESSTRARTLYGCPMRLYPGDVIECGSSANFYVVGKTVSGSVVNSNGWKTYYPVSEEGDYVFTVKFSTEAAPAGGDYSLIAKTVTIHSINAANILQQFREIQSPARDWEKTVRSINHRGYNTMAPENTLPAFRLSKANGFGWIETDVHLTSDNVFVCIHNATVDATSNGTGNVASMTLAQLKALDFGSWFSADYAGTTIPTLKETLSLCRGLGMGAYVEVKITLDATKAAALVSCVRECGMTGMVQYISSNLTSLGAIAAIDNKARLGYVVNTPSQANIDDIKAIATQYGNPVFIDMSATGDTSYALCLTNNIEVENWTIDNATSIAETMPPIVVGVTSNFRVAGKYLYLANR